MFYLATVYGLYNPFEVDASYGEIFMLFADETAKGALFDILEVFRIDLQDKLFVDAKKYVVFGSALAGWRTFVSAYALATGYFAFRRAWGDISKFLGLK